MEREIVYRDFEEEIVYKLCAKARYWYPDYITFKGRLTMNEFRELSKECIWNIVGHNLKVGDTLCIWYKK